MRITETMRITAVSKLKHGGLWAAIKRLGWSQSELARRTGMHASRVGEIINLKTRPTEDQANAICFVLGENGILFDTLEEWPELFKGLKHTTREDTIDVSGPQLLEAQRYYGQLPAPMSAEEYARHEDDKIAMAEAMDDLRDRERTVIRLAFGMDGPPQSCREIGERIGRSQGRVLQLKNKAIEKMRGAVLEKI